MSTDRPLRIVFAGTPDFAATILTSLLDHSGSSNSEPKLEVVAVYCQPDRPAGRGRKQRLGAVKQVAVEAGLPIFQPKSLQASEQQAQLASLSADVMLVVAYGLILPLAILETPKIACINVHASLLPRWRGAAPIQRAIIAGDAQTGVTIMQMEEGLDTGPMIRKASIDIEADDTSQLLHDKLAQLGAKVLLEVLNDAANNCLAPIAQNDAEANYAQKLTKLEAAIDWTLSAKVLQRQVLGLNPWPVAYCQFAGEPLRVWQARASTSGKAKLNSPGKILSQSAKGIEVATGEGELFLTQIQLPGKRAIAVSDFINANNMVGEVLS